jgi:hypothetical protein
MVFVIFVNVFSEILRKWHITRKGARAAVRRRSVYRVLCAVTPFTINFSDCKNNMVKKYWSVYSDIHY